MVGSLALRGELTGLDVEHPVVDRGIFDFRKTLSYCLFIENWDFGELVQSDTNWVNIQLTKHPSVVGTMPACLDAQLSKALLLQFE